MKKLLAVFFDWRFFRFCLVGLLNTAIGAGIMFGLYNLAHVPYWPSTAANYVLTSILSYFLNKRFTFGAEGGWRPALRFSANIAVCYVVSYAVSKRLVPALMTGAPEKLAENAAMLAGMVIFTGLNYLGQRFFAFRPAENAEKGENDP